MARSDAIWLDSDVILDWLTEREPWSASITELVKRAVAGEWTLWVSPLIIANVHFGPSGSSDFYYNYNQFYNGLGGLIHFSIHHQGNRSVVAKVLLLSPSRFSVGRPPRPMKSEFVTTYTALDRVLQGYPEILTSYQDEKVEPGAISGS